MKIEQITKEHLSKYSLKEYFDIMFSILNNKTNIEILTTLFTNDDYTITRPYLYRRQLKPIDNRFTQIELVYDSELKLCAVIWDIKISFNELLFLFGEPIIQYFPIVDSTYFEFSKMNSLTIDVVKTTIEGNYKRIDGTSKFTNSHNIDLIINNLVFTYIQLDLIG